MFNVGDVVYCISRHGGFWKVNLRKYIVLEVRNWRYSPLCLGYHTGSSNSRIISTSFRSADNVFASCAAAQNECIKRNSVLF